MESISGCDRALKIQELIKNASYDTLIDSYLCRYLSFADKSLDCDLLALAAHCRQ